MIGPDSITYLDDFDSDDSLIQGTCTQKTRLRSSQKSSRHSMSFTGETRSAKPKMRLSQPEFPGKENEPSTCSKPMADGTRGPLKSLYVSNQSLPSDLQDEDGQKPKLKRRTSFKVYNSEDDTVFLDDDPVVQKPTSRKSKSTKRESVKKAEIDHECQYRKLESPKEETHSQFYDAESCESNQQLDEQAEQLITIFPNVDPLYLKTECRRIKAPIDVVTEVILSKLERNQVPSRADYVKKVEMDALIENYNKNFSPEKFLKIVPDPWTYYESKERDCGSYKDHSLYYLKTKFRKHYAQTITDALNFHNNNLYLTYKYLMKKNRGIKLRSSNRPQSEINASRPSSMSTLFLQEMAFIENEELVKTFMKNRKLVKKQKLKEASRLGTLLQCECCLEDELLLDEAVICNAGHVFCQECVLRFIETEMGNGKCQFSCLTECDEKYSLKILQELTKPEVFSKIVEMTQILEIEAAGLEDLAHCPFCFYVVILPPEMKVLQCLNPRCMKESCRLCKEPNHLPLKCEEVEKSEEVKVRTFIEGKMTDAMVRTCWKCNRKFIKGDGCNKMVCSCGAKICYFCRLPVKDYSHFYNGNVAEPGKCPLYSTNDQLHVDAVKRVAKKAKEDILRENPNAKLFHDPTEILPEYTYDSDEF